MLYKIIWWDDLSRQRAYVKSYLQDQLDLLSGHTKQGVHGKNAA